MRGEQRTGSLSWTDRDPVNEEAVKDSVGSMADSAITDPLQNFSRISLVAHISSGWLSLPHLGE